MYADFLFVSTEQKTQKKQKRGAFINLYVCLCRIHTHLQRAALIACWLTVALVLVRVLASCGVRPCVHLSRERFFLRADAGGRPSRGFAPPIRAAFPPPAWASYGALAGDTHVRTRVCTHRHTHTHRARTFSAKRRPRVRAVLWQALAAAACSSSRALLVDSFGRFSQ